MHLFHSSIVYREEQNTDRYMVSDLFIYGFLENLELSRLYRGSV